MPRKNLKTVSVHVDVVGSNASYYDTPGPVFYFYKPIDKGFREDLEGAWVETNVKKVFKKNGFHLGSDYGVIKMPRYDYVTILEGTNWITSTAGGRLISLVKEALEGPLRTLNQSGTLLVSVGELELRKVKKEKVTHANMMLGLVLTPMSPTKAVELFGGSTISWTSE